MQMAFFPAPSRVTCPRLLAATPDGKHAAVVEVTSAKTMQAHARSHCTCSCSLAAPGWLSSTVCVSRRPPSCSHRRQRAPSRRLPPTMAAGMGGTSTPLRSGARQAHGNAQQHGFRLHFGIVNMCGEALAANRDALPESAQSFQQQAPYTCDLLANRRANNLRGATAAPSASCLGMLD